MSFSFTEKPDSRSQQSVTDGSSCTLTYNATGEQNDYTVHAYAIANTATFVDLPIGRLYRKSIKLQPIGFQHYEVTVEYAPPEGGGGSIPTGSYTFNFDTTGGTVNIKCAKEHINSYPAAATTPNHAGAIAVEQDGTVTGADIVIPALKFSLSFKYPSGIITVAWVKSLASITGTTNSAQFLGFAAGELLFIGATGSNGSAAEVEVTFNFIASQNATGLQRGGITGIAKKGHEIIWEELGDNLDSNGNGITKARAVHVERVYDSADFATYLNWNIFTG